MNIVDNVKDKLTYLQDEFADEGDVDEADNSEAPADAGSDGDSTAVEELAKADGDDTQEEPDQGTGEADAAADGQKTSPVDDGNCSFFFDLGCENFMIYRYVIQWTSVVTFIVMIAMNSLAQAVLPYTLSQVTEDWSLPIDPAGYAFSIWGLIYFLLALYTIYQALPTEWITYLGGRRNDEVIFLYMAPIFIVNTLFNAAWLPVFQSNTLWGFIVGWFLLVGIWITNTSLMVISQRFEMWWLEVFLVRLPFSIYSGWVTGATVLNTAYMLKSWGMADDPNRVRKYTSYASWDWAYPLMEILTEEEWTIVALWMVEVFNEAVSWWERNPAWGSVYTWASAAILVNNVQNKAQNENLIINGGIIVGIHAISQGILFCYLIFEEMQPWYQPLSFWNGGLFGLVDWSEAFKQIRQVLEYPEKYLYSLTERETLV